MEIVAVVWYGTFNRAPDFGSQEWRWNQKYWTESGALGVIFLQNFLSIHINSVGL